MPKTKKMKKNVFCVGFLMMLIFTGCSNRVEAPASTTEAVVQEMTVQESQATAPAWETMVSDSTEATTTTSTMATTSTETSVSTEVMTSLTPISTQTATQPATQPATTESTVITVAPTEAQSTYTEVVPMFYHTHQVVSGDTWYGIAKLYHVDMDDLLSVNNASEDTIIFVDEFINIPSYGYYDDNTTNYCDTPDYSIPAYNAPEVDYNSSQYSAGTCLAYQCMTYSNTYNNSWKNIVTSAQYLNGTVLYAGDTFSWFSVMGPCDYSQGYIDSDGYAGNQVVQVPGGGICFTSTNLHLCARSAGMEILERHDHSMPVWYAGRGDEASVSYGSWDLRFYNSTGYDIIIYSSTDEYGNFSVSMYTI